MSHAEDHAQVEKLWVSTRARESLFGLQLEAVRIGRYVLLEEVGHGAMGIVYAAYDATLDRKVAIKLVHAERSQSPTARRRLLREAKAMARVSHPNIVQVYEAAEHEQRLFLAMELVDGTTVRDWLHRGAGQRGWREIIRLFVGVARGLAQAHRAGIVHRDLKPDNILVSGALAKVADFGLAGLDARSEPAESSESGGDHDASVTATGQLVGTPLYMAPEQHARRTATAASDQFAFCASVWEALADRPPFDGDNAAEIEHNVLRHRPCPLPPRAKVPRRVREALERGLAVDVEQRWPSMDALGDTLAASLSGRRRGWALGGAAIVAGSLGALAWAGGPPPCSDAEAQIADVWDARRAEVERAFVATELSHAQEEWGRVEVRLDDHARAWAEAHTEACEATRIRRELSVEAMDLSIACLRRARLDLRAVVDVLAQADADVVGRAQAVVGSLPPIDACSDVATLRSGVDPPSEHELAGVERVRQALATARALRFSGKHDESAAAIERAQAEADPLSYEPVRTEIQLELGWNRDARGAYEAAIEAFGEAQRLAMRSGQWDFVTSAATRLMFVLGYRLSRYDEALMAANFIRGLVERKNDPDYTATFQYNLATILHRQAKLAEAAAAYTDALEAWQVLEPDGLAVASALNSRANVLNDQGESTKAEADHRRALAIRRKVLNPKHPHIAESRSNLGNALYRQGRYAEAEAEYRAAVKLRSRALTPEHPETLLSRSNLAAALAEQGDYAAAEAEDRAVLEIRRRVLGPTDLDVGTSHLNLGAALSAQGRKAEALVEYRAALRIKQDRLTPQHPTVARTRGNIAAVLVAQGQLDEAEQEYGLALDVLLNAHGPEHPRVTLVQSNIADLQLKRGDQAAAEAGHRATLATRRKVQEADHPEIAQSHHSLAEALVAREAWAEAEAEFRAALAIRNKAFKPDHPRVSSTQSGLGAVLNRRGRHEEARELLEPAWETAQKHGGAPAFRARTAFALAQALWAVGERPRARELARSAQELYDTEPDQHRDDVTRVSAWLKKHR